MFLGLIQSIQIAGTNEAMVKAMKATTETFKVMNRQTNVPAIQRLTMEFEKENDHMEQRQEMMEDAMDELTGYEDEEEEGDEILEQTLAAIGIDLKTAVSPLGFWTRELQSLT